MAKHKKPEMDFERFIASRKTFEPGSKGFLKIVADGNDDAAESVRIFQYPNDYIITENKAGDFTYAWVHPRDLRTPTRAAAEIALWEEYAAESFPG